jgi:hypothetical protein
LLRAGLFVGKHTKITVGERGTLEIETVSCAIGDDQHLAKRGANEMSTLSLKLAPRTQERRRNNGLLSPALSSKGGEGEFG